MLHTTRENPIKNDFVKTCESFLNMDMTFEELSKMSKWRVKQLVKLKSCLLFFDKVKEQTKQNIAYTVQRSTNAGISTWGYYKYWNVKVNIQRQRDVFRYQNTYEMAVQRRYLWHNVRGNNLKKQAGAVWT